MSPKPKPIIFNPNETPLKLVKKLHKKKEADAYRLCIVEGWKCVEEACSIQHPRAIFLEENQNLAYRVPPNTPIYHINSKDFQSISNTQTPEGIMGLFTRPKM